MPTRQITPNVPVYTPPEADLGSDFWKNYGKNIEGATAEHDFFRSEPGETYEIDTSFTSPSEDAVSAGGASGSSPGTSGADIISLLGNAAAIDVANNMSGLPSSVPFSEKLSYGAESSVNNLFNRFRKKPNPGPTAPTGSFGGYESFEAFNADPDILPSEGFAEEGWFDTSPDALPNTTKAVTKPNTYAGIDLSGNDLDFNWGGAGVVGATSFGLGLLSGDNIYSAAKSAAFTAGGYLLGEAIGGSLGGFVGGAAGGLVSKAAKSVICTELYNRGLMPWQIYRADQMFGEKCPEVIVRGYHWWAKPAVRWMKRSNFAVWLAVKIALPWAYHMAYEQGVIEKDNKFGKFISKVGMPICAFIGACLSEEEIHEAI